jgi:hypothetical protein
VFHQLRNWYNNLDGYYGSQEEAMHAQPRDIAIRFAAPADRAEVERLAQLDSAGRVDGDALVALVDGRIRAALPLARGRVIADPFEPSAELASLLRLRARQLHLDAGRRERTPLRALAHALPLVGRHA